MPARTVVLRSGETVYTVTIEDTGVRIDGREVPVTPIGGHAFRIEGARPATAWAIASGSSRWVFLDGVTYELEVSPRGGTRRRTGSHHGSLTAPMPATVRQITVSSGDRVERGDTLIVLEAMKMELPIKSTGPGKVLAVKCREGDLVEPGAELIEIEDSAS